MLFWKSLWTNLRSNWKQPHGQPIESYGGKQWHILPFFFSLLPLTLKTAIIPTHSPPQAVLQVQHNAQASMNTCTALSLEESKIPEEKPSASKPLFSLKPIVSWQIVKRLLPLPFPFSAISSPSETPLATLTPPSGEWKTESYPVWLNDQKIATFVEEKEAQSLVKDLNRVLTLNDFDPLKITPIIMGGKPAGKMGHHVLFTLNPDPRSSEVDRGIMAIQQVNSIRAALQVPQLPLVEAQRKMYQLVESPKKVQGLASWYGPYFHGRLTANGETYNQYGLTAAHPSLPLNTYLKVTNLNNQKSVIIRVNDRGPYIPPRSLDLSLGAARCLDSVHNGVIPYRAVIMQAF